MLAHLLDCSAFFIIFHKHRFDQVYEILIYDTVIARLVLKDSLLQPGNALGFKREIVCCHIEQGDAEGPHVGLSGLDLFISAWSNHFGREVIHGPLGAEHCIVLIFE